MYIRSLRDCEYGKWNRPEWQEFERLVRDCAAVEFGQEFHLFGRSGQKQHGIDVFSDDWETLIQCKDYRDAKALMKAIAEDFETARSHFQEKGSPFFHTYIIATTLDTDAAVQEKVRALGGDGIQVDVWFWDDICRIIDRHRIRNDADDFIKGFREPLFLHKDCKDSLNVVSLENLFIHQAYQELGKNEAFGDTKDDLKDRLNRFFRLEDEKLLIIEGDAGSGKSSLVAWICYEAEKDSRKITLIEQVGDPRLSYQTSPLLAGRPLFAVRLRDLSVGSFRENALGQTILSHLHIGTKHELEQKFSRAVIILDGFDELCMMEGLRDYENMIYQFCNWVPEDCKVLITSRPRYIQAGRIDNVTFSLISLEHFSPEKRDKWLSKYISLFPEDSQAIDPEVADYIRSVSDETTSNICDTPLTLYLLVGSKANFALTRNIWSLYHHIFSRTVVETEYAKQMKPENKAHPMGMGMSDLLYQITEETAYKMFSAGEERGDKEVIQAEDGQFLVMSKGIKKVVEHLLKSESFQSDAIKAGFTNIETRSLDLSRSHALCCYWKTNADRGLIEFYHNNIRDFFLCEKLYRGINGVYQKNISDSDKVKELAKFFITVFRHGILNSLVCTFLRERARNAVSEDRKDEFPVLEKLHPLLPKLYEYMLLNGKLYDKLDLDNHIRAIQYILHGTAQVYFSIYEPILEDGAYIHWWESIGVVKNSDLLDYIFCRFVGRIGYRSDLSGIALKHSDLFCANFNRADLRWANLHWTYLFKASLHKANLTQANLIRSILVKANLSEAVLYNSLLVNADLSNADLYKADLRKADLTGACLHKASLFGARLNDTILDGVELTGADLKCATLPDGFQSPNQKEQIAHLKSLNIPGLRI